MQVILNPSQFIQVTVRNAVVVAMKHVRMLNAQAVRTVHRMPLTVLTGCAMNQHAQTDAVRLLFLRVLATNHAIMTVDAQVRHAHATATETAQVNLILIVTLMPIPRGLMMVCIR